MKNMFSTYYLFYVYIGSYSEKIINNGIDFFYNANKLTLPCFRMMAVE